MRAEGAKTAGAAEAPPADPGWHAIAVEEVLGRVAADLERGLDAAEVVRRRARYGPNRVTVKEAVGPLMRFLLQLHQPLIYILLAATAVTLLLREWIDAGVIFGVVLVNAMIGFLQESKALKALDALVRAVMTEATVLRGGRKTRLPSADLVPGDVVLLQSGDKVPADLRLARTRDLQVDESALTGESLPVEKAPAPLPAETTLGDRRNMAYSSALVTYGQGTGIVVATGDATEVGRISGLIASATELATPLVRKIGQFSHLLLYVILALAAVTFGVGVLRGESAQAMFMAAVALAVGAIPEGLPAAMTITLAIGVARMARRRAIIRKLPAVEALGSTTVICSDKTGTLTENQMTVAAIEAGGTRFSVSGGGYAAEGALSGSDGGRADPAPGTALGECLLAGLLCNDTVIATAEGKVAVQGDPTEAALLVSAAKAGIGEEEVKRRLPRLDAIPFESLHQYMATLHDAGEGKPRLIYLKGAVEAVLQRCSAALAGDGRQAPLEVEKVLAAVDAMAANGLRILAFARGEMPAGAGAIRHEDVASGLVFLGLQGMIDPPREAATAAVATCRRAGIHVKMITGDHAVTAAAIAKRMGIDGEPGRPGPAALTGRDLEKLPDADFVEAAERTAVFARVTPEQKLRLVEALQARGQVVAMTGDGVNDAPALKQADIGVAMGISGTDVAKEAADMVLTDDDFATIAAAVEEGRGVFDNLTKFIVWTLPTNLGEGLVILAAVVAGTALPVLPVQILWINMTTAVFLGLTLAFEAKERDIMDRPPRDPKTPILTGTLIGRIVLVGLFLLAGSFGLFEWMLRSRGATEAEARTVAVNVFVLVELMYLLNCRSLERSMFHVGLFSNRWLIGGVTLMLLLQLAFTYAKPMNRLFHSAPVDLASWAAAFGVAAATSAAVGTEKWLRRWWAGRVKPDGAGPG